MDLSKADLGFFLPWLLLDSASREPAKRQTEAMTGLFVGRLKLVSSREIEKDGHPHPIGKTKWQSMTKGASIADRRSDRAERCYVAMRAQLEIERCNVLGAAAEVARILGVGLDSVRTDYYRLRRKAEKAGWPSEGHLGPWPEAFFGWRRWALDACEDEIQLAIQRHEWMFGGVRTKRFRLFLSDLRRSSQQIDSNRAFMQEIVATLEANLSDRSKAELGPPFKLGALVSLIDLYDALGQSKQASDAIQRARDLCAAEGIAPARVAREVLVKLDNHLELRGRLRGKPPEAQGS